MTESINSHRKYKVVVTWTETGIVEIEEISVEDAIKNAEKTIDDIPLPESEYLDESFRIDKETTKLMAAGIIVAALQIMRAAVLLLQSTLPLLLLAPFSCYFWTIGIAFVYVTMVSLITVLNSFKAARFIRRKEYACA